jgi:hypothetical protein
MPGRNRGREHKVVYFKKEGESDDSMLAVKKKTIQPIS